MVLLLLKNYESWCIFTVTSRIVQCIQIYGDNLPYTVRNAVSDIKSSESSLLSMQATLVPFVSKDPNTRTKAVSEVAENENPLVVSAVKLSKEFNAWFELASFIVQITSGPNDISGWQKKVAVELRGTDVFVGEMLKDSKQIQETINNTSLININNS